MSDELYYTARAAYEEGYETASQSYAEIILAREKLLGEWLQLAAHYGYHCDGIDAKTRTVIPPQFLPENTP